MRKLRVAVLVTVHNRVEVTMRGLSRLASLTSQMTEKFEFAFYLVDDGSTDGTATQVRELPLDMTVVTGSGSLYWNGGMTLAYRTARDSGREFDAYMLYNDDVLVGDEFGCFLETFAEMGDAILVGAFRQPSSSQIVYSGFVRVGRVRPLSFRNPEIVDGELIPVDTFNGNLVLVPAPIFDALGGLDPGYTHAYGDIDLGLRAGARGVRSYVYGSPVGSCEKGPTLDERVRVAGLKRRWELLFGYPHGLHSYLRFARVHCYPALMPAYAIHESMRRLLKLIGPKRGGAFG